MKANTSHVNFNESRQRDHQRQQERLKAMAASGDKVQTVSADKLIENLLKDPFKELPQTPFPVQLVDQSNVELPTWLQYESDAVPPQYKYLWSIVYSTVDMADTQKVSQLLLTSGLQVDILGFIWSLANRKVPGQLTKQEFYIVLALVSLAQSGYAFNDLSVLKLMTIPSIPILQVGVQKHPIHESNALQDIETSNFSSDNEFFNVLQSKSLVNLNENEKNEHNIVKNAANVSGLVSNFKKSSVNHKVNVTTDVKPNISMSKTPEQNRELSKSTNFPCIGSSPTAELEDDFSAFQSVNTDKNEQSNSTTQFSVDLKDDFTEFQSAAVQHLDPFETVVINQKREVPKIPFPKTFSGKFTNLKSAVLKISPETEKKLKVLSPSESLSSLPESKISSSNKVSTGLSVLGTNHGIGSRLANHSARLDTKLERPKYPKYHNHHKINLNSISPVNLSSEDEIVSGVKSRNSESGIPKSNPENLNTSKTFILKETKIGSDATAISPLQQNASELEFSAVSSRKNTRQIEIPMLGIFNETNLPTQSKPNSDQIDLISVQEDKYSALRDIELELNQEKNHNTKEINDEFGDFLSANIPNDSESILTELPPSNPDSATLKAVEKDDWGDWNFNVEAMSYSLETLDIDKSQRNTSTDLKKGSAFRAESDLFDAFTSLATTNECSNHTSQSDYFLQNQQNYFGTELRGDNINDIVKFDEKNEKLDDDLSSQSQRDQAFSCQPDNEFWEFLSTDIKPQSRDVSRQSSLPSLDLKISSTDESEQETVWRKCLDSCHSLIQEGYEIFNSIGTKWVLDEVFAAPKTVQYLNNLNIAFQISKRVTQNFNNFPSVQEELEKFWVRLQDLCFEYNIKLKHDEDDCLEGKIRCKICLRRIGYYVINKGSNSYHPSCANLWINCVEPVLPSLV